jgi:uncharacterized protein
VQTLLNAGASISKADNAGLTPLHCAVRRGDEPIAALLLQQKAPVNAATSDGQTPLILAARLASGGMLKLLLANGADPEAANSRGDTALHFVMFSFENKALPEILDVLIASGCEVDEETNNGLTPLMLAASRGNLATAKLLLDREADINATDTDGNTPLLFAIKSNAGTQKDFIQELLNRGADPLHVNAAGESPESLCQAESRLEIRPLIAEAAQKAKTK